MSLSENTLLTVQEVALILKLSVLTIYKYIREHQLEVVEFGGHYRIKKGSLEQFIENHTLKAETEDNENQ